MVRRNAVVLAAAVVVGLGSLLVMRSAATTTGQPLPGAVVAAPAEGSVIAGPGRVEAASEEIEVAAELSGKLAAVLVDEGDRVDAGQVIARLEQRDFAARVASAEAQLAVAIAERTRLVNGARPEERREVQAVAEQAVASLDHARIAVERARRLYEEAAISRNELDEAERNWRVAEARRTETAERAATIDGAARADERARADASVDMARAHLAEAQALLAKTVVRAPIDGLILRRHRQAGESVSIDSPSPAIVTMADARVLRVRVDVDERDVAGLAPGQRAWVTAGAYGDRRFTGRIIRVGQILGRKNVRTDEPTERADTKILETLVELDPGVRLPLGLRVDAFIQR